EQQTTDRARGQQGGAATTVGFGRQFGPVDNRHPRRRGGGDLDGLEIVDERTHLRHHLVGDDTGAFGVLVGDVDVEHGGGGRGVRRHLRGEFLTGGVQRQLPDDTVDDGVAGDQLQIGPHPLLSGQTTLVGVRDRGAGGHRHVHAAGGGVGLRARLHLVGGQADAQRRTGEQYRPAAAGDTQIVGQFHHRLPSLPTIAGSGRDGGSAL